MPDKEPSRQAQELASQVERDGGRILALYQERVGERWQIFCLLPRAKCEASPYQRDLSPTHVKRLTESIKRLDRFVDPIVIISPRPGVYWTPNGNHRRAVLDKLKADFVPAILVVEPEMVFEVLPLNVQKAHNLKEKSLEVIRRNQADHPGAQDAPVVRADLQEAPREPRGVRRGQGPLRRHPALIDHAGVRRVTLPLAGQVALVTGGTGALGQAVTLRLLTDGAVVAVPYAVEAERDRLHERVAATDRPRLVTEPVDLIDLES